MAGVKSIWSKSWQPFPILNFLLNSSWITFWFVTTIPNIGTMPYLPGVYKLLWYNHLAKIHQLFSLYSSYCVNYCSLALIICKYMFLSSGNLLERFCDLYTWLHEPIHWQYAAFDLDFGTVHFKHIVRNQQNAMKL
jgi:hypothetical protein